MSGKPITDQQIRLYMNERKQGKMQVTAAAKAGFSERSARRIDKGQLSTEPKAKRHWRTRKDPLDPIWNDVLVPMLEADPQLLPMTLFEYLCDHYPEQFDTRIQRTLQRRVKSWKAKHGPAKEVMFRQTKEPGRLGLSDFTLLKGVTITLLGQPFCHLLYHYRLAFSGWCYAKVICGGESFTALSTGLQNAFWRCGGVPQEHRTDSLSAAFNNLAEQELLTKRYHSLCEHYSVKPTRNNPGKSHENGAIESPHGYLKRRIDQALRLRGSYDFVSLEEYQSFIDDIVNKMNRQCQPRFDQEREQLQTLPLHRTQDYAEHWVRISSSSTFDLKRVTYSVPSRFIGERLYIQLYDERLELYHDHERVLILTRVYASKCERVRCVNYRHVIDSLVKKPQAFRYSQLRDDLLPSPDYHRIWAYVNEHLEPHKACRYIVRLLHLASRSECEDALGRYVLAGIDRGKLPTEDQCRQRFSLSVRVIPIISAKQHALSDYDQLLTSQQGVKHG